jgi:hypothetical protein
MELAPFFGVAAHSRFYLASSLFWCLLFLIGNYLSPGNKVMKRRDSPWPMEENTLENARS